MTTALHCGQPGEPPVTIRPAGMLFNNTGINPPSGTPRGVMVFIGGLSGPTNDGQVPGPLGDSVSFGLGGRFLTLANTIAALGWYVLNPVACGFAYRPGGANQIIYNDLNTDSSGHGSRLAGTYAEWWDHVVWWIQRNVSSTLPIVPVGMSMGGFTTLQIALQRTSTIAGFVAHHPLSVLSNLNPTYSAPLNWTGLNTTGANVTSVASLITIPAMLGWGSIDTAIDYPNSGDLTTPALYTGRGSASVTPNCDGTGTATAGSPAENHILTGSADNANPNNDVFRIAAWFSANLPHN